MRQTPVVEKTWARINGVRQGMFIRGHAGGAGNGEEPVLLFVHGGPGMPEFFLDRTTHPTLSGAAQLADTGTHLPPRHAPGLSRHPAGG